MTSSAQASWAPCQRTTSSAGVVSSPRSSPRRGRLLAEVVRRRDSGQRRMWPPRCTRSLETCPYPPSPPLLPSPPSPPPPRPPPALSPSAVPPVPVELVRRCLLLRRSDAAAMGSIPARLAAERRVAPRSSGACSRGRRREALPSSGAPRRRRVAAAADAHRSARASSDSPTRPPTTCRRSPHMACAWLMGGAPAAALEAPAPDNSFDR